MKTISTLINARWVIPVEPDGVVLEHHSVAIRGRKIVEILQTVEVTTKYQT